MQKKGPAAPKLHCILADASRMKQSSDKNYFMSLRILSPMTANIES